MPRPTQSSFASAILRGSLIALRRKCGTPTCRCLKGNLHETPALSYSLQGSTKMLTLRPQDVPGVRAALKRYQKAVRALEREALAGIRALRKRIQNEKAHARRPQR